MEIRAVLEVLLEQLGRQALPTLPSAVPSCRQGSVLRAAETPSWKHPVPLQSPNRRRQSLAQTEDCSPGPGLGSSFTQQPHYPYPCISLSLQGLEETFPNIEVTCEFSTPQRSMSGLEETSVPRMVLVA